VGNVRGVHVEAPDIGKSFVDKADYGRGPLGTLYYNDKTELKESFYYNVTFTKTSVHTPHCVIIQFFKTRQGPLVAQFIGQRNKNNALSALVEDAQGTWNDSNVVASFAHIDKNSDAKAVKITVKSIRKVVTFDIPDNIDISNGVHVGGQVLTIDIGLITKNTKSVVSWDRGRIVFHPENGDTNSAVAVFYPIEAADTSPLGNVEEFLSGVAIATWTDT